MNADQTKAARKEEPSSQAESFQVCLQFDFLLVYNYDLELVVAQSQSY